MAPYNETVRNFVANGGKYLGFCLGGYLAGLPGFGLLPQGDNTYAEIAQPGAQVKTGKNTIIQVDWTFHTGKLAGQTKEQWMFFQDGGTVKGSNTTNLEVLGRFASNQNIAAAVSPFGKGWVGVTGPHPEADQSWCESLFLSHLLFDAGANEDFLQIPRTTSRIQTASISPLVGISSKPFMVNQRVMRPRGHERLP